MALLSKVCVLLGEEGGGGGDCAVSYSGIDEVRHLPDPRAVGISRVDTVFLMRTPTYLPSCSLSHPPACTPARGRDQQSWFAAQTRNPALLEALMELFLGPLASASTRLEITTSLINMVRGLQGKPHLVVKTEDPFKTGPFLQADADTKRQAY